MTDGAYKHEVGDPVQKTKGDYTFYGWVVSTFKKRTGTKRIVVENAEGILHIFNEDQLESWK